MTHDDRAVRIAYALCYADHRPGASIAEAAGRAAKLLGSKPEDVAAWAHARRVEIVFGHRSDLRDDQIQELVRLASMGYYLPVSAGSAKDPVETVRTFNRSCRSDAGPWHQTNSRTSSSPNSRPEGR